MVLNNSNAVWNWTVLCDSHFFFLDERHEPCLLLFCAVFIVRKNVEIPPLQQILTNATLIRTQKYKNSAIFTHLAAG